MKPWQNPVKIPNQDRWWTAAAAGSIGQSRLFQTTNQVYIFFKKNFQDLHHRLQAAHEGVNPQAFEVDGAVAPHS